MYLMAPDQSDKQEGIEILIPPINLCTDNAAMIACAAYYKKEAADFSLAPIANLKLPIK